MHDEPQPNDDHERHHDHEHVDYPDAMRAHRADKDAYYRTGERSPIPAAERAGFGGLPYFDVDEDLVFEDVVLEPYMGTEPASFQIPTSDGQLRPAVRAGILRFEVEGVPCSLTAYTFEGAVGQSLFVPFLDGTTGTESYGAGRYLDLAPEDDGTYVLDFTSPITRPACTTPASPARSRRPRTASPSGSRPASGWRPRWRAPCLPTPDGGAASRAHRQALVASAEAGIPDGRGPGAALGMHAFPDRAMIGPGAAGQRTRKEALPGGTEWMSATLRGPAG